MKLIKTLTFGLLLATSIASADYYIEIDCPRTTMDGALDELIERQHEATGYDNATVEVGESLTGAKFFYFKVDGFKTLYDAKKFIYKNKMKNIAFPVNKE